MKHLLRLSALMLMALTMAFAAISPAAAQSATPDPITELNKIAKDVTIYGRSYEADMTGTPVPDQLMPVTSIVQVYVLDDAKVAEEAFPHVQQLMIDELESVVDAPFKTTNVDGFGTNATLSTAEVSKSGISVGVALYLVQEEDVIYLTASVVANGEAKDVAMEFLTFMMDQEPGKADTTEFNQDGTSTGGYFDVLPTDKDTDVLHGMMVTEDMYEASGS